MGIAPYHESCSFTHLNGGMPTEYLYLQMTHIFFLLNHPPHQKEKKKEKSYYHSENSNKKKKSYKNYTCNERMNDANSFPPMGGGCFQQGWDTLTMMGCHPSYIFLSFLFFVPCLH